VKILTIEWNELFYHDWSRNGIQMPIEGPARKDDPEARTPPIYRGVPVDLIFAGPSGVRAGWRLAIYLACFYFLLIAFSLLFAPLSALLPQNSMQQSLLFFIQECASFVAAVAPAIFLARVERRPFAAYGLDPAQAFGVNFWVGVLWGILSLTILLCAMRAVGAFYFGGLAIHGPRVLKFAVFWGALFLVVGLYEEFIVRGYTQFTLATGIGFWPAAGLISVVFGASHLRNPDENWAGALGAALIGLFWCLTLRRTGNLWFAVGMHAAWDWGESFLYSVPDSGLMAPGHLMKSSFRGPAWLTGGPVGPEGSVLILVLFVFLWILFARLYPEVKYKLHASE
jgi:membrane protease YdiL (CAAX protease family)